MQGKRVKLLPQVMLRSDKGTIMKTFPSLAFHQWEIASAKMARESSSIPGKLRIVHNQTLRVC